MEFHVVISTNGVRNVVRAYRIDAYSQAERFAKRLAKSLTSESAAYVLVTDNAGYSQCQAAFSGSAKSDDGWAIA